jgi:FixJ family two-component response regulator
LALDRAAAWLAMHRSFARELEVNNSSATVFVVDDDADVRRALGRLLQSAAYDVRSFATSAEFLTAHDPQRAGCVILDLAMPDMDGLAVQASLAASGTPRPIIFLSGNGSIATSVKAMRAGAVTFLTKPVEGRQLLAAVEEGLRLDSQARSQRAQLLDILRRIDSLTPREREVLTHVVAGRLNKQIAADLGTVVKTIKVHRARVMHKMGVRSVAQLARIAAMAGIEPPTRVYKAGADADVERCSDPVLAEHHIPNDPMFDRLSRESAL